MTDWITEILQASGPKPRPQKKNPEMRRRIWHVERTYNITYDEYEEMLFIQGGGCAICSKTPEENGTALAVDHDHSCCPGKGSCGFCVRKLLCSDCNRAVGLFGDSPEIMRKAAEYMEHYFQGRKASATVR